MKTLLIAFAAIISLNTFAVTDLSGLYGTTTEPTLKNIVKELKYFKNTIKYVKLNTYQRVALAKLEKSLKASSTSPTLKRDPSHGPNWRSKLIKYIEAEYDVWENVSYTDEDGDASEECNFDEDGVSEIGDYYFTYESVKNVKGSQTTIAYIASLVVSVYGKNKVSGVQESCDHTRSEYAFEAKLISGKVKEIEL